MRCTEFYPVIMTDRVDATADFYIRCFRFEAIFRIGWYVHLRSREDARVNLAILDGAHETVPAARRSVAAGMIVNFEVEDVDAEHARAVAAGAPIVYPLTSERFGQRHFMSEDPAGVLIDVITPIPPDPDFLREAGLAS